MSFASSSSSSSSSSPSSSGFPGSTPPPAPNTLNRFQMELHNLQQRGEVVYTEEFSREGPANNPSWTCWMTIVSIQPAYKQDPVGQTFWGHGEKKQVARDNAAQQVLRNINFDGVVH